MAPSCHPPTPIGQAYCCGTACGDSEDHGPDAAGPGKDHGSPRVLGDERAEVDRQPRTVPTPTTMITISMTSTAGQERGDEDRGVAHAGIPATGAARRSSPLSRAPLGRRGRRCSCLTRMMSGSRGSSGSDGSACPRLIALAVRRCLVIRICDIPHPSRFGWCRSLPSRVTRQWPAVVMASTPMGARQAAIPGTG
jgi:hypothetical protein